MARVALIQEQDHPELAEAVEKYRSGRRGKLINIYRMLLNAPPLAESWFNHSNTVRWKTTLSGRLREIVIIRMGRLTDSQYVLRQHVGCRVCRGVSMIDAGQTPLAVDFSGVCPTLSTSHLDTCRQPATIPP